jgi:hypothetical protein
MADVRDHIGYAFRCELCGEREMVGYQLEQHLRREHGVRVPFADQYAIETIRLGDLSTELPEAGGEQDDG